MTNLNGLIKQAEHQEQTRLTATQHRAPWTGAQYEDLRNVLAESNWKLTTAQVLELAESLGRTYGSIIVKAHEMREAERHADEQAAELRRVIDGDG